MRNSIGYSLFIILCVGVFFLPLLLQILLFVVTLFLLDRKYFLLLPAALSDVLYMPKDLLLPHTVLYVVCILVCIEIINRTTRLHI